MGRMEQNVKKYYQIENNKIWDRIDLTKITDLIYLNTQEQQIAHLFLKKLLVPAVNPNQSDNQLSN